MLSLHVLAFRRATVSSASVLTALLLGAPSASAAPLPVPIVSSVVDGGHYQGTHQFTLTGQFPFRNLPCATELWTHQNSQCYGAHLLCNGGTSFGQITSLTTPGPGAQTMTVRFPERPTGSSCSLQVKIGSVSREPNASWISGEISVGAILPGPLEIFSVADRGRTGASRFFELYGNFPTGQNYQALVSCDGNPVAASVVTPNNPSTVAGQVNIGFLDSGTASRSCELRIRRASDNATTPPWSQRLNGSRAGNGPLPSMFGAYHWGGFQASSLEALDTATFGVRRLREAGLVGPMRLVLDPRQEWNNSRFFDSYYDFTVPAPNGVTFDSRCASHMGWELPRLACTTRMQHALDEVPAGGRVIFTAMDGVSLYNNGGNTNLAWISAGYNYYLVKEEYYRLAKALYATQSGGKTFVIANWETDNMIYNGSAYGYVTDNPSPSPADLTSIDNRIQALRHWFSARQEGIEQAAAEAGSGAQISVVDGIEFAAYRFIHTAPFYANRDALHGIVPYIKPRYALYSSWETTNSGRVDQDFREISEYLTAIPSSHPITFGIGEFGRPGQLDLSSGQGRLHRWIVKEQISAAKRVSAQTSARGLSSALNFAIVWMGYDTIDEGQGLLTTEGVETTGWRAVAEGAAASVPAVATGIAGVREAARTATHRTFELYGSYGAGPYLVQSKCNTQGQVITEAWTSSAPVSGGSAGQVNVVLPLAATSPEWWCTLRVQNGAGIWTPDFGPIQSCPNGPCNP